MRFSVMLLYHKFEQLLHSALKYPKIQNIWIVNKNLICSQTEHKIALLLVLIWFQLGTVIWSRLQTGGTLSDRAVQYQEY